VGTPIPYLLVWKDERHGGEIKEAVRLARYVDPHDSSASNSHVELWNSGQPSFAASVSNALSREKASVSSASRLPAKKAINSSTTAFAQETAGMRT